MGHGPVAIRHRTVHVLSLETGFGSMEIGTADITNAQSSPAPASNNVASFGFRPRLLPCLTIKPAAPQLSPHPRCSPGTMIWAVSPTTQRTTISNNDHACRPRVAVLSMCRVLTGLFNYFFFKKLSLDPRPTRASPQSLYACHDRY